ncbi:hypothetical protein LTR53_014503 [Teratosphaeriaceae sp. CCFEE 6253]|nr:hypothetical protein LTR53_014503 [Teratosphaeriaceae sp. CCFEE 6253]
MTSRTGRQIVRDVPVLPDMPDWVERSQNRQTLLDLTRRGAEIIETATNQPPGTTRRARRRHVVGEEFADNADADDDTSMEEPESETDIAEDRSNRAVMEVQGYAAALSAPVERPDLPVEIVDVYEQTAWVFRSVWQYGVHSSLIGHCENANTRIMHIHSSLAATTPGLPSVGSLRFPGEDIIKMIDWTYLNPSNGTQRKALGAQTSWKC